jgi:hypothetical protein
MVNQNLLGCFLSGQHLHGTRLYSSGLTGARALYRRKLLWFSASSEAGCRDSSRSVHPTFRPDQPWFSASGRASCRDSFLFHEPQVTSHPSLSPLECAVLDKYRVLPGFGRSCPYVTPLECADPQNAPVTPLECADAKKKGGSGPSNERFEIVLRPGRCRGIRSGGSRFLSRKEFHSQRASRRWISFAASKGSSIYPGPSFSSPPARRACILCTIGAGKPIPQTFRRPRFRRWQNRRRVRWVSSLAVGSS